jgi:hypothetical protein
VVWIDRGEGPLGVGYAVPACEAASASTRLVWAWRRAGVGVTISKGPMGAFCLILDDA